MLQPIIKVRGSEGLLISVEPNKGGNYNFAIVSNGYQLTYFNVPWKDVELVKESD